VGLILAALPVGFGLAAVAGERLLPDSWPDRRRCVVGAILATACAVALAGFDSTAAVVVLLGLLGVGLGVYLPANNAAIMAAVPSGGEAAAGGLVSMARGLGTALGVAAVAVALHAGASSGHAVPGRAPAMLTLAVCGLAALWASRAGRTG
jgi:MFS family permease